MIGNLIDLAEQGHFDVIVHGCNCFHTMGAGVAKEIKNRYPRAYDADVQHTEKGDDSKLGHYTWAIVEGKAANVFTIINAYTQFHYGRGGLHVDYEAIRSVFALIKEDHPNKIIAYPCIGAGLAGGDWSIIQTIINQELTGMVHHLVTLK